MLLIYLIESLDMEQNQIIREKNRIYNIIWNLAEKHKFIPVFTSDGLKNTNDFYINMIAGIIYKNLGEDRVKNLFKAWKKSYRRELFDLLSFFALEKFFFNVEAKNRPVLKDFREKTYLDFIKDDNELSRRNIARAFPDFYNLYMYEISEVLRLDNKKLSAREKEIYNSLTKDISNENIDERIIKTFEKYYKFRKDKEKNKLKFFKFIPKFQSFNATPLEFSINPAIFGKSDEKKSSFSVKSSISLFRYKKRKNEDDKIASIYGKSLFSKEKMDKIENKYCNLTNKGTRLFFTEEEDNNKSDFFISDEINILKQAREREYRKNILKYREKRGLYLYNISVIRKKLSPILNKSASFFTERMDRGDLISDISWMSKLPNENKIFKKKEEFPSGKFYVDLLLDASSSRKDSQEEIAIQAYIIAKSLFLSGVKVRVTYFQTVGRYTIFNILKSYDKDAKLENIMKYNAAGWNRDSLAFSAVNEIMYHDPKKTLIIVFTDANPSDCYPLKDKFFSKEYSGEESVLETKKSVDALRKRGFQIFALISGKQDKKIVEKIYHGDYQKIMKMDDISRKAIFKIIKLIRKMI